MAHTPKPSNLPGLLALLMGVVGLSVLVTTIQIVNTEQRAPAQDDTKPTISIKTNPTNPRPFETLNIEFQINTKNRNIGSIEMKNLKISGKTWAVLPTKLDTAPAPQLSATQNSLVGLSSTTATITYVAGLADANTPYNTGNEAKTFAKFSYVPQSAGTLLIDFDPSQVVVKEYNGTNANIANDPKDTTIAISTASPAPEANADTCPPQSPTTVKASPGDKPGEIRLSWSASAGASHYAISFGPKSTEYQWGAANVGNVREFTIRGLTPGNRYYIVVSAVNSCGGGAYSKEASALAKVKPATTIVTTKGGEEIEVPLASYKPEIVVYNPPPLPSPSLEPSPVATESSTPLPEASPTPEVDKDSKAPFFKTLAILIGILLGAFLLSRFIKIRKVDGDDDLAGPRIRPASPTGGPDQSPERSDLKDIPEPKRSDLNEPSSEPQTLINEPPLNREETSPSSEKPTPLATANPWHN